ncbi:alpha,alpha-trehalase TreF [Pedobacter sp. AW1-32]|uniref:alpha,alpha-trehalase TreF n=1 Tax=Pedobacter sp. AW1-32 TaxID=3383026 RepID=UPI003FEFFDCF
MKKYFIVFLWVISFSVFAQEVESPRQLYPGLFESVQLSGIFPDGKTFVDATPKKSAKDIMAAYQAEKAKANFSLKTFVEENFEAPQNHTDLYRSDVSAGIEKHLDTLWTVLKRQPDTVKGTSLLPLPKPYIVPGGRFREIYYWDSYFTMLGLKEAGKADIIKDMVDNFAFLIRTYGFIPNGNRSYYLTRSQPPFFSMMVALLAEADPKVKVKDYQDVLLKEYAFWMKGLESVKNGGAKNHVVKLSDGTVLNRYWDAGDYPREESYAEDVKASKESKQDKSVFYRNVRSAAESGWDFSTRWFADGQNFKTIITTDLVPVDLNGLMYHLECTIAQAYTQKGETNNATLYNTKAEKRKAAILKYCWNSEQKFFTDYNWKTKKLSTQQTLAAVAPLFFGIATKTQAAAVAQKLKSSFLKGGGLITTLVKSGQQWDNPNAWAPLQWMSIAGLQKYGYNALSNDVATRWMKLNTRVFEQTGKMMEKYDVTQSNELGGGGEYPLQDGFGWTNGVMFKLLKRAGN